MSDPAGHARHSLAHPVTWVKLLLIPLLSGLLIHWIAETDLGVGLTELSYATAQSRLGRAGSDKPPDVTVVDISGLPQGTRAGGSKECYRQECITDRDSLLAVIKAVVAKSPSAIGIDIDFSPEETWVDPQRDPWFLGQLLSLRKAAPIYVVAGRRAALGRGEWLGGPQFAALAADATRSPRDPRAPFTLWERAEQATDALCSMPALLSRTCVIPKSDTGNNSVAQLRPHWAGEGWKQRIFPRSHAFRDCSNEGACVVGEDFLVDYGSARDIELATCVAASSADVQNCRGIPGKKVLLGFAGHHAQPSIRDQVPVPAAAERTNVPGVVALAAATQTLLDGPVGVPGTLPSIVLDCLFVLLIFLASELVAWRYQAARLNEKRLMLARSFALPIVFALLGFVFARATRIVWSDYLIAVPIVFVMLWLEPRLDRIGAGAGRVPRWFVQNGQGSDKVTPS